MFGIGLDDAFVIFGEYIGTDETKDPVWRIQKTFEEVGLSVFLTTLTTSVAFALGCLASLPTLYWLSLYAFPTVLVDFFCMITFFVAIIVIDERRIKARELQPKSETKPLVCRIFDAFLCRSKPKEQDDGMEPALEVGHDLQLQAIDATPSPQGETTITTPDLAITEENKGMQQDDLVNTGTCATQSRDSDEARQSLEHELSRRHQHVPGPPASIMDQYMKWYAKRLLTKPVKICVLIFFTFMTIGLAFSASQFTQEFNIYEVLTGDSYVAGFFSNIEKYADRGFLVPEAYFRNVNQSDPVIQQQMEDFVDDLVGIDSITSQPPFFWLRHFKEFLSYDDRLLAFPFNLQLDIFFTVDVFKTLYGDHIVRDPETGDILASRCVMYMDELDMEDVDNQIQAWRDQLDVTIEQPINSEEYVEPGEGFNFFLYEATTLYVWEFYQLMVGELILASIVAMCTVTFISFLFLPHWTAALFLAPIMAVLYIDLIGTFALWFAVDFPLLNIFSKDCSSLFLFICRLSSTLWCAPECNQLLHNSHVHWSSGRLQHAHPSQILRITLCYQR